MQCAICNGFSVLSVCEKCNGEAKASVRQMERNLNQPWPAPGEEICILCQHKFPKSTMIDGLYCQACMSELNEEEMELDDWIRCANDECKEERWGTGDPILCHDCTKKRVAEFRDIATRAYFAALSGCCACSDIVKPHEDAYAIALATVRQWDSFMAQVDKAVNDAI